MNTHAATGSGRWIPDQETELTEIRSSMPITLIPMLSVQAMISL